MAPGLAPGAGLQDGSCPGLALGLARHLNDDVTGVGLKGQLVPRGHHPSSAIVRRLRLRSPTVGQNDHRIKLFTMLDEEVVGTIEVGTATPGPVGHRHHAFPIHGPGLLVDLGVEVEERELSLSRQAGKLAEEEL